MAAFRIQDFFPCVVAASLFAVASEALAATYRVGPGRTYATLHAVASRVNPGDLVEVDGDATYPGGVVFNRSGTAAAPITVRGLRVNGRRPALTGVNGISGGAVMRIAGNFYVIEGFDMSTAGDADAARVIYHAGNGAVIRDTVVHDSPVTGISGADSSGSLTLQHVEVSRCGSGSLSHQIYVGSDNARYPGAVFRMEFCYVHDSAGGNNVKSRAGRNEIYYNWIEGAVYHELDLIGADATAQPGTASLVREDSDVVGNVLIKSAASAGAVARLGGDGTGSSHGRYRFASNAIVIDPAIASNFAAFKIQEDIESLELHNNVFDGGGRAVRLLSGSFAWQYSGANNWLPPGSTGVPAALIGTVSGAAPGFVNAAAGNLAPSPIGALFNAGKLPTQSPASFPFPSPLAAPLFHPPVRTVTMPATPRPTDGAIDIGAFEHPPGGGPNTPPQAVADEFVTASITPFEVAVLQNDSDAESDPLAITSVTQGAAGSVTTNGSVLFYSPSSKFAGTDTFSYRVSDGRSTATAAVTVRNPFVVNKAIYSGLVSGTPASNETAGYFKATLTGTGRFSGSLKYAGGSFTVNGVFDLNGNFSTTIARKTGPPLQLSLRIAVDGSASAITGTVSDGVVESSITAGRVPFNTTTNRAPQAGKYTLLLPAPAGTGADVPPGHGYATLTVSTAGSARISGKLGDATTLSSASYVLADGTLPVLVQAYSAPRGTLFGTLTFRDVPAASDCDGTLAWTKPAQTSGTAYRAGFATTIEAIGSRYARPPTGTCVLAFADAAGNGEVRLSSGDLPTPIAKVITLGSNNLVTIDDPSADQLSIKIATTTGVFSGKFIHPGTARAKTFSGVVFQKKNFGRGVFLGANASGPVGLSAR